MRWQEFEKMEELCFKKCISDIVTPSLKAAEKSCLDRCAYKFKEALDFGENSIRYIKYKIFETNMAVHNQLMMQNPEENHQSK